MKKQNENNPVVIGALLVVLLGAVVVIFRSFAPQSDITLTPMPTPAPSASPAAALLESSALTPGRDPFFHSDIQRIAASGEKLTAPTDAPAADGGAFAASDAFDSPLAPDANGNALINPIQKKQAKATAKTNAADAAKRPTPPNPAIAKSDFAHHLRLTAVLGGERPRAIVEGGTPQPIVVGVGDSIGILRVVALRAQEIVLSGAGGLWTIPLQSAAPTEAPTTDNVIPAVSGDKEPNHEAGK